MKILYFRKCTTKLDRSRNNKNNVKLCTQSAVSRKAFAVSNSGTGERWGQKQLTAHQADFKEVKEKEEKKQLESVMGYGPGFGGGRGGHRAGDQCMIVYYNRWAVNHTKNY
jgi:hypothetical protein